MAVAIVSGPPLCFGHSTQKSTVALVGAIVGLCRMYARGLTEVEKRARWDRIQIGGSLSQLSCGRSTCFVRVWINLQYSEKFT